MRRLVTFVASTILILAIAAPAAASPASPTIYLALGDSLAWGDGASVPDHTGYVPRLAGYFQGASHGGADSLVNLAIRGESTASFLSGGQMAAALATINDPATDTRVVTISIGGNDLLDLLNDPTDPCVQDPSSFTCQMLVAGAMQGVASRLPLILGGIQGALATDPGTEKLFAAVLYNPFGGTGSPYEVPVDVALRGMDLSIKLTPDCAADLTDPLKTGLDDIQACIAVLSGAIPVDLYPVFDDNALALTHMSEGFNIHPNDHGYALIAQAHRAADRASD